VADKDIKLAKSVSEIEASPNNNSINLEVQEVLSPFHFSNVVIEEFDFENDEQDNKDLHKFKRNTPHCLGDG